jgi:DNA-directed RNA polymerase subunit F
LERLAGWRTEHRIMHSSTWTANPFRLDGRQQIVVYSSDAVEYVNRLRDADTRTLREIVEDLSAWQA